MKRKKKRLKVGIVGCGAIGSRMAHSVQKELKKFCTLNGIYDIDEKKSLALAKKLKKNKINKPNLKTLIKDCDLMVEAVSAKTTQRLITDAIRAKRDVLALSVGKLLNSPKLFKLAETNNCNLLMPSGAIAGIDAVKAASLVGIKSVTLTTRKPVKGFLNNEYLQKCGINLKKIKKETVIYDGNVSNAVKWFPANINVAATLSLAAKAKGKLRVRILASPHFKNNSHEIEIKGKFGRMVSRTENVVCPDNPKTSYLAVLSGIETLQHYCSNIKIGS